MKVRVLWICNLIIPEFCEAYNVKTTVLEGWMSGMYREIRRHQEYEIACCFPIIDESRMKSGNIDGMRFYSFHAAMNKKGFKGNGVYEFLNIYKFFKPDIIHIWGSEYYHSKAAVMAAKELGISDRVIIHVQGLVSACSKYYNYGVAEEWRNYICNGYPSMKMGEKDFSERGHVEIESLKSATLVLGRTSWDKAVLQEVAPDVDYRYCGEILRQNFYKSAAWNIGKVKRHSLFFSQANYPIKGIHLIIPAIAKLREYYPDLSVIIAGNSKIAMGTYEAETPYDRYLLKLMDEYGLRQIISFKGLIQADEMIENYLLAHAFVCPSTIENSSNSIGEAQILGTPVVASYTGGTPDLVQHGETGLLYQMDADYMFLSCVRKIFENDDFAVNISNAERVVSAKRHDPQTVCGQLLAVYREIVLGSENDTFRSL